MSLEWIAYIDHAINEKKVKCLTELYYQTYSDFEELLKAQIHINSTRQN